LRASECPDVKNDDLTRLTQDALELYPYDSSGHQTVKQSVTVLTVTGSYIYPGTCTVGRPKHKLFFAKIISFANYDMKTHVPAGHER